MFTLLLIGGLQLQISKGEFAVTQISQGNIWHDDYNYFDDCYDTTEYNGEHWCTSQLEFGIIGNITTISPENGKFHGWIDKSISIASKMTRYFSCLTNSNVIITWDVYWNCGDPQRDRVYYYPQGHHIEIIEYNTNSAGNLVVTPSSGSFLALIDSSAPCGYNSNNIGYELQKSSYEDSYNFKNMGGNEVFAIQFAFYTTNNYGIGRVAVDNLQIECVAIKSANSTHSPTTAQQSITSETTEPNAVEHNTTETSTDSAINANLHIAFLSFLSCTFSTV
eukprot:209394_1